MKVDLLIQNLFNLFVLAIIIEAAASAIFSMTALKDLRETRPVAMARDVIVLIVAVFLCYKVKLLTIFGGSGIKLPYLLDTAISALVLTSLANFIRNLVSKMRVGS